MTRLFPDLVRQPQVMAILNVTPDSFSDGGLFQHADTALAHAEKCVLEGADILDIGAESTRPGHVPISAEEEVSRLVPVLDGLRKRSDVKISVDTYKASVARIALEKGADIINDVWGLQRDPRIAEVVGRSKADVILMHNRFDGADPSIKIWEDMDQWFDNSLEIARKNGIAEGRIILDPGIGFGKTFEQNLIILANLDRLKARGFPVLMGLSRKRFLGAILGADVEHRLFGTMAGNIWSLLAGVDIIRVHDVKEHYEAVKIITSIDEMSDRAQ